MNEGYHNVVFVHLQVVFYLKALGQLCGRSPGHSSEQQTEGTVSPGSDSQGTR